MLFSTKAFFYFSTNKKTEDKFISKKKEVMSLYVNAEFENQICLALDHIKDMVSNFSWKLTLLIDLLGLSNMM